MKFLRIIAVAVLSFYILLSSENLVAVEVDILYFERPPYYLTVGNEPAGFLNDLTRQLFTEANMKFNFYSMPPKRIIKTIKNDRQLSCSPGWFKNKERQGFAKFTLPFYQNLPMVILSHSGHSKLISSYKKVESLIKNREMILGKMAAFSYGQYLDDLIDRHQPKQLIVKSSQKQLIRLLNQNRISYIFIAPEEVDSLIDLVKLNRKDFVKHTLPGLPEGNKRYLMCSKGLEDKHISRLNRSIKRLVPTVIWSD